MICLSCLGLQVHCTIGEGDTSSSFVSSLVLTALMLNSTTVFISELDSSETSVSLTSTPKDGLSMFSMEPTCIFSRNRLPSLAFSSMMVFQLFCGEKWWGMFWVKAKSVRWDVGVWRGRESRVPKGASECFEEVEKGSAENNFAWYWKVDAYCRFCLELILNTV